MSNDRFDREALHKQLTDLLEIINKQIEIITIEAISQGYSPVEMRTVHGDWIMTPLLQAKAQTLNSLVLLKEKY